VSDQEPGLQAERTALAWARTAAVALVTSILLVRHGLDQHQPMLLLGAAATMALAALALRIHHQRVRAHPSPAGLPARSVLALAALTSFSGLSTLAGILWAPS
jgi:Domain of unknown function (DUF202)